MMRRLALFALAVAASATLPALADAYPFTVGEAIPLFDSSDNSTLSYVTLTGAQKDGTIYEIANTQNNNATIVVNLTNSTQGDSLLSFLGAKKDNSTTYTVTVQGTGDAASYTRTATGTQDQTSGGWSIDSYGIEHLLLLDALPAGDFTLTLTANRSGSWAGHYGNFTIKNLSGNALDMAESSGSAFVVEDQSYVKVLKNAGNLTLGEYSVGSTKNNDSVQFSLFSTNATGSAKYGFSFDVATNDNYPTVTWRLIGPGVDRTFSDRMPSLGGSWNIYTNCTYNLGILPNGAYILTMSINSNGRNWAGNYKNFTFTTSGNIDVTAQDGLTLDADADWTYAIVTIEDGATVDLHGFNLVAGSVTANTRGVLFTNSLDSAERLSTLTVDAATVPKSIFGGNLKVVQTGTDAIDITGETYGANTHSGGTELSTSNMKLRSTNQFGSGAISLTGSVSFNLTAGGFDYTNWSSDFNVTGEGNSIYLGGTSGASNYSFAGGLTGDGAVTIFSGWQASITMTGDLSAFEGTLNFSMSKNTDGRGLWLNPGNTVETPGLPNANVVMANPGSNSSYPQNRVFIQKSGDVEFGSLATAIDENNNDTYYSTIYAATQGVNLKVGTKADATYTGRFAEHKGGMLSIEKVGADTTWTLTSTNHNFSGAFVVSAGKVVFNNADKVALGSGVTVGANGTIGGSGTITSPITFTSGAKVEVAAGGDTLTFSSDIDASTLTVKLTGELDTDDEYTILTAGSGSSGRATSVEVDTPPTKGRWRTKWVTSGDTKILKGYYVKPGMVIIFK